MLLHGRGLEQQVRPWYRKTKKGIASDTLYNENYPHLEVVIKDDFREITWKVNPRSEAEMLGEGEEVEYVFR